MRIVVGVCVLYVLCVYTRGDQRGDQGRKRRQSRDDDDGPLVLSALVVLSLRPRGEDLVLAPRLLRWFVLSFVRSFARLLVRSFVRSLFSSCAPGCLSSFVPSRLVLAAAYRRLFVSFVRARRHSPSTEATVLFPTPISASLGIEFFSPVCTLSLASFTFSCTSSSSCSSPFRLRWTPLVLLINTVLCISLIVAAFSFTLFYILLFFDFRSLEYPTFLFLSRRSKFLICRTLPSVLCSTPMTQTRRLFCNTFSAGEDAKNTKVLRIGRFEIPDFY